MAGNALLILNCADTERSSPRISQLKHFSISKCWSGNLRAAHLEILPRQGRRLGRRQDCSCILVQPPVCNCSIALSTGVVARWSRSCRSRNDQFQEEESKEAYQARPDASKACWSSTRLGRKYNRQPLTCNRRGSSLF